MQADVTITLAGYLTAEEGKVFKKRYVFIDSDAKKLKIYTEDPKTHPSDELGSINLQYVSRAAPINSSKQKYENCFSVTAIGDEYVFKASSLEEMQRWIETLNRECRVTVPKESSGEEEEKEVGPSKTSYKFEVVGGVVHKSLVDGLSEDSPPGSDPDTEDDSSSDVVFHTGKIVKSGYAIKQGIIVKNWKRRYFILDDEGVSYYVNENTEKPIRSIPRESIIEARRSVGIHLSKDNLFEIVTKQRVFYLQVDDEDEVKSWISAINTYIADTNDLLKNAEVQTTNSLERNATLHVNNRSNSQSTASQTADFPRMRQQVTNPLPNRSIQSYSTYL